MRVLCSQCQEFMDSYNAIECCAKGSSLRTSPNPSYLWRDYLQIPSPGGWGFNINWKNYNSVISIPSVGSRVVICVSGFWWSTHFFLWSLYILCAYNLSQQSSYMTVFTVNTLKSLRTVRLLCGVTSGTMTGRQKGFDNYTFIKYNKKSLNELQHLRRH